MLYDHIVFPGAFADIIEEYKILLNSNTPKQRENGSKSNNVNVKWYGGGFVSMIEENTYYYFTRANNLNFGYSINSVEALRHESYKPGGKWAKRKECNHFYQNTLDRKLLGIMNLNDAFDPDESGGKIVLYEGNTKRSYLDNVFYEKPGSFAVINTFTGYEIEKVSSPLEYLFCFCVGNKWH